MIALSTARRRAEELDAAVSRRASGTAKAAPELAPLLDVVTQLRDEAASAPAPRPEFSSNLRALLMAEAETALVAAPAATDADDRLRLPTHTAPRRQRRVAAVAAAVVLAGSSSTMAYAAQDALPGDSLYPVKRALEGARGTISLTDEAKGTVTLRHAAQRLAEVEGLVERDDTSSRAQVPDALGTFTEQADEATTLLLGAAADNGHTEPVVQVRSFVADSIAALTALEPSLAATDRPALADAVELLQAVDALALEQCATCGTDLVELPLSLTSALSLAEEAEAGTLPDLPSIDLADLPPGSISGPGAQDPAPLAPPAAETDPGTTPPSSGTPSTPAPGTPPSTTPTTPALPDVPPLLPPSTGGGLTGTVGGITGLTGPLQEPLDALTSPLTQTLDQLLGLGR